MRLTLVQVVADELEDMGFEQVQSGELKDMAEGLLDVIFEYSRQAMAEKDSAVGMHLVPEEEVNADFS